jgi:hypothetical protein
MTAPSGFVILDRPPVYMALRAHSNRGQPWPWPPEEGATFRARVVRGCPWFYGDDLPPDVQTWTLRAMDDVDSMGLPRVDRWCVQEVREVLEDSDTRWRAVVIVRADWTPEGKGGGSWRWTVDAVEREHVREVLGFLVAGF